MDYTTITKDETDFTATYIPPEPRCEQCQFYGFIDSGYGWCRRYPPQPQKIGFIKATYKAIYPCVAWMEVACGEFKKSKKI